MDKLPWFRWYGATYRSQAVHSASRNARALYLELISLMWTETDEQGFLIKKGKAIDHKSLRKLTNFTPKQLEKGLRELLKIGDLKRDDRGVIYSPLLADYITKHELMSAYGRMGGNPRLTPQVKLRDNAQDNLEDKPELEIRERNRGRAKVMTSQYRYGTPIDRLGEVQEGSSQDNLGAKKDSKEAG